MRTPFRDHAVQPRPSRSRSTLRTTIRCATAIALGAGALVVGGATPAGAATEPVITLTATSHTCPEADGRLFLLPRLVTDIGHDWQGELTLTLTGDSGTSGTPLKFRKEEWGYDRLNGYDDVAGFTGVDWDAVGANPRIEVTWTYQNPPYVYGGEVSGTAFSIAVDPPPATSARQGTGTSSDPFLVGTVDQLQDVRCTAGGQYHYLLTNDIDLGSVDNMLPLGSSLQWPFGFHMNGTFDGDGHTISNLRMDFPGLSYPVGLFGLTRDLAVRDLTVDGAWISGDEMIGVLSGHMLESVVMDRVKVTDALVEVSQNSAGLVAGRIKAATLTDMVVGGTVRGRPLGYRGADEAQYGEPDIRLFAIGGISGFDSEQFHFERIYVDIDIDIAGGEGGPLLDSAMKIGGLLGEMDQESSMTRVDGVIDIDVEALSTGPTSNSVGGLIGGYAFDSGSTIADSTLSVDMTVRAPSTSEDVFFQDIGLLGGSSEEGSAIRLDLSGTLTVDTRPATGNVTIDGIAGAIGRLGSGYKWVSIVESHIDADIVIYGNASKVGALFGARGTMFSVNNVRVGGSVTINSTPTQAGDATSVAGLVGESETISCLQGYANNVVWRGDLTVAGTSSGYGTLWAPPVGLDCDVEQGQPIGENVWWDSTINGVTTFDSDVLGRPATSTDLADADWLDAEGFDLRLWCVADGVPSIRALAPSCPSSSRSGTPSAPGQPTVVHGAATTVITWTAPDDQGWGPITKYIVTSTPGNITCETDGALSCSVTGLTPGTPYTFTVVAQNYRGTGANSVPSTPFVAQRVELPATGGNPSIATLALGTLLLGAVFVRLGRRRWTPTAN